MKSILLTACTTFIQQQTARKMTLAQGKLSYFLVHLLWKCWYHTFLIFIEFTKLL